MEGLAFSARCTWSTERAKSEKIEHWSVNTPEVFICCSWCVNAFWGCCLHRYFPCYTSKSLLMRSAQSEISLVRYLMNWISQRNNLRYRVQIRLYPSNKQRSPWWCSCASYAYIETAISAPSQIQVRSSPAALRPRREQEQDVPNITARKNVLSAPFKTEGTFPMTQSTAVSWSSEVLCTNRICGMPERPMAAALRVTADVQQIAINPHDLTPYISKTLGKYTVQIWQPCTLDLWPCSANASMAKLLPWARSTIRILKTWNINVCVFVPSVVALLSTMNYRLAARSFQATQLACKYNSKTIR